MSTFYTICKVLGVLATIWIFALLVYLGAPWWAHVSTLIAVLLIEFGCFASRDQKHEAAMRHSTPAAQESGAKRLPGCVCVGPCNCG